MGAGPLGGLRLLAQAANAGARLGSEFLRRSNIPTVHDALRLVEDAGHLAGGIVINVWHVERARTPPDELAALPLHRIVGVEPNDADREAVGTLFEKTVDRRRYCGEALHSASRARRLAHPRSTAGGSRSPSSAASSPASVAAASARIAAT